MNVRENRAIGNHDPYRAEMPPYLYATNMFGTETVGQHLAAMQIE